MRIGIQTWGSNGDIRPLIALGGGLRAEGHDVTVAVTSVDNGDYSALAAALGVALVRVPERMDFDMPAFAARAGGLRTDKAILEMLFRETFHPYRAQMYEAAKALCRESDIVIGHFLMYPLKVAALKVGLPFASVTLCHGLIPTAYAPPPGLPDLGRWGNRLAWYLGERLIDRALRRHIDDLWLSEGLEPFAHVLPDVMFSEALDLVAVSPALCRRQPDWRGHEVCGFFGVPGEMEPLELAPSLERFLDAGDAPVYMTLGSSGQLVPEHGTSLLIEAARLAGVRAIVQTPLSAHRADTVDGDVYFIGRTPHHAVFPYCSAVVHHGGAGTTHSATRAGRPSVVVAFIGEQAFWGRELRRLGAGSAPLAVRTVTPARLARAIRLVLADPSHRRRAEELSSAMKDENGVARAVKLIEQLAASGATA